MNQLSLFAWLWAVAALFHVWVNPHALGLLDEPTLVGVTHVVLVVGAVVVLAVPRPLAPLALLCVTVLVSAWYEAPFVGNHWVLAAMVSAGFLLAAATAPGRPDVVAGRFLPIARVTVLVFYAFAAFAKLNHGFFDVDRSCAAFFFDESAASLGFDGLRATGSAVLGRLVVVGSAMVELAVPVLLLVRRTRVAGVVLALVFHLVVALDRTHLFADFTAGLDALLVLFLPASFATWLLSWRRRAWTVVVAAPAAVAVLVTAALVAPVSARSFDLFDAGRQVTWFLIGPAVVAAVVVWVVRHRQETSATPPVLTVSPRWLLAVPVLAACNGLTPYVELKTGFGWNMYANLVTAGGETNHFLLPATLDLTGAQDDLVTIVSSGDPSLQVYADEGWKLAWLQLRAHLSHHPDVSVTYERAGAVNALARAADDPSLVAPLPAWREKLQLYRAVDTLDPPRCQATWLPAR